MATVFRPNVNTQVLLVQIEVFREYLIASGDTGRGYDEAIPPRKVVPNVHVASDSDTADIDRDGIPREKRLEVIPRLIGWESWVQLACNRDKVLIAHLTRAIKWFTTKLC